jgi:hypothetical protein
VKKAHLLYFDAGGGHRAAASALCEVMEQQRRPFEIRLVNVQEVLDSIDVFRRITGVRLQDIYNLVLKRGWTLGSTQLKTGMQLVIRMFHASAVEGFHRFWQNEAPDLVVSLIPHLNRAIGDGMRRVLPDCPMVTILTDIADCPPHFWMERQEQHFICGSEKALSQAIAMGHAEDRVHLVSGMILSPRFYEIAPLTAEERAVRRKAMGFDPSRPVGMVMFGGQGAAVMKDIAERLEGRQLLMICGHNASLAASLRTMRRAAAMFVEGFTKEIPRYMQLADFFIGKPGPGSISEAVAMHLPVIVERNAWTLPQERYNADWVREKGVGIVLPGFRGIARAVDELLEPATFTRFREATRRVDNRAVFEIPGILERIADLTPPKGVERTSGTAAGPAASPP